MAHVFLLEFADPALHVGQGPRGVVFEQDSYASTVAPVELFHVAGSLVAHEKQNRRKDQFDAVGDAEELGMPVVDYPRERFDPLVRERDHLPHGRILEQVVAQAVFEVKHTVAERVLVH